jgi:peptidoglycan/xylan/chitin deacetylase (PgdA/CDA1 family)
MPTKTTGGLRKPAFFSSALLLCSSVAMAGPVTTVPWNGHTGAVTFTFDDACASQLSNVVPALKARKINATFFLYNSGNAFTGNKAAWIAAAKDGNELANHTLDHANLSTASNGATEVSGMATLLRNADTSVQAVTLAYPGCAVGSESAVGSEDFLARGCIFGNGPYSPLPWKTQPSDWLNVGALYNDTVTKAVGPVLTAIDAAAKNGGWFITLNHGVGGDWISVPTTAITGMFDRAIKDGVWIGTFQDVGAYWRASFTMDKVAASGSSPWNLSWSSPHSKMPKSVKLKVKLDSATFGKAFTVAQDGTQIFPNTDGSFTIDFMKLKLAVKTATTGISRAESTSLGEIRWSDGILSVPGLSRGRLQIVDAKGRHRIVEVEQCQARTGRLPGGLYQARLLDGATTSMPRGFVVVP